MEKFEGLYLLLDVSDLSYLKVRIILQEETLWTCHVYNNVIPSKKTSDMVSTFKKLAGHWEKHNYHI